MTNKYVCIVIISPQGDINLHIPKELFKTLAKNSNKATVTLRLLDEA